jgi:fructose-1,6-bisphosphatase/inositol monophosphatase family enzyme
MSLQPISNGSNTSTSSRAQNIKISSAQLAEMTQELVKVALQAGELLLDLRGRPEERIADYPGDTSDPVTTRIDQYIERTISRELGVKFSGIQILGEENSKEAASDNCEDLFQSSYFTVDGLDGTSQYAGGRIPEGDYPQGDFGDRQSYGTILTYNEGSKVVLAIVCCPERAGEKLLIVNDSSEIKLRGAAAEIIIALPPYYYMRNSMGEDQYAEIYQALLEAGFKVVGSPTSACDAMNFAEGKISAAILPKGDGAWDAKATAAVLQHSQTGGFFELSGARMSLERQALPIGLSCIDQKIAEKITEVMRSIL